MHPTLPTAWSVCDVKTLLFVFLFHTSALLVQISTHLKRPIVGLRLQKPECFVCYTKRYVQIYNILLFMPVTGNEIGGEYIFQNLFGSLSP